MSGGVPALAAAQARVVLARGSRSFSFAGAFLPASCRDDAAVVYAFCRAVDDVVDERGSDEVARAELRAIESELRGRAPARPLIGAYLEVVHRRDVGVGPAIGLLRGVESDLGLVRIEDDAQLLQYCYRVAGTVGLMMSGVLGVKEPAAAPFAVDLGVAMQLTNICRDVLEDAKLGRVYLPRARLLGQSTTPEAICSLAAPVPAVVAVTEQLLDLAEQYYASAELGLRFIPARPRLAIRIAAGLYREIGRKLRRAGGNPLRGRTVVGWPSKIVVATLAMVSSLRPSALIGANPPQHDGALHRHLAGCLGELEA